MSDQTTAIPRFYAWGSPNPLVSAAAGAATTCEPNAGSVQSFTSVGEFKVYNGGCVTSVTLPTNEWGALLASNGSFGIQKYEQAFAQRFKDDFDFIIFVIDSNGTPNGFPYSGFYATANTRVPSRTRRYLGYMMLTYIRSPQGFLNPIKGGPVLHEFMHEWANNGLIPSSSDPAHWGFASTGGQLGGFAAGTLRQINATTWQARGPGNTCLPTDPAQPLVQCNTRNSFGTFVNGGNSVPYSDVELFVMGLLPAASTPNVDVALDGVWSDALNGTFTATRWASITPAQIASSAAGRIPQNAGGQRNFRVATIVLTPNAVLDGDTLNELNSTLSGFSLDDVPAYGRNGNVIGLHNFHTATKRIATMRAGNLSGSAR